MRRPVRGYEGLYEVDNFGRVFSLPRTVLFRCWGVVRERRVPGRQLKQHTSEAGYAEVSLYQGGRRETWFVHRLVLLAFRYREDHENFTGNHKDGDTANNRLRNLEWATQGENNKHAYDHLGRQSPMKGRHGSKHPKATPVAAVCPTTGETKHQFDAIMDAERAGFRAACICECLAGTQKTHAGYTWKTI